MRQPVLLDDESEPQVPVLPRQSTLTALGTGRPTALTPHVAQRILTAVRAGAYRGVAAQYAGVTRETLSRWLRRAGEPYETFRRSHESWTRLRTRSRTTSSA